MTKYVIIIISVIAIIGGSVYAGYSWGSNKTAIKYITKLDSIHDTTYLSATKWKQVPARIDTIASGFIIQHDTIKVPLKIARADSVTTKDSSVIKVSYYFPPVNKFDIDAEIKEHIKVITETKNVVAPLSFWDRFGHGPEIGLGYGMFNKKIDVFLGYGFHYKIN